jgi:hypothetical protein
MVCETRVHAGGESVGWLSGWLGHSISELSTTGRDMPSPYMNRYCRNCVQLKFPPNGASSPPPRLSSPRPSVSPQAQEHHCLLQSWQSGEYSRLLHNYYRSCVVLFIFLACRERFVNVAICIFSSIHSILLSQHTSSSSKPLLFVIVIPFVRIKQQWRRQNVG